MTFNIGVIIGPIMGGILSDPAGSYPKLFGHIDFFKRFPYATPNLVAAFFFSCGLLCVWLCLEEVSLLVNPLARWGARSHSIRYADSGLGGE